MGVQKYKKLPCRDLLGRVNSARIKLNPTVQDFWCLSFCWSPSKGCNCIIKLKIDKGTFKSAPHLWFQLVTTYIVLFQNCSIPATSFRVDIVWSHSIYSHGKILDTDLRVTDFRVTVLFVSLGITKFTSQGKRSHWNFFLEKHAQVPEKFTVTEKKLHWIYFPRISVPEFAVTNAKNTEFSYNHLVTVDLPGYEYGF